MNITKMNITKAKYHNSPSTGERISIKATIDGVECFVPIDEDNTHYIEIKRQVDAGELTIEDAD